MRRIFLVLGVFFIFVLVGCKQKGEETQNTEMENSMEKIVLTEQEERLLCDLYIDEERIREGYLYGYQKKCLEQIRFGVKYLEETYPDKDFELLMCHPKSKVNMVTTISFQEEGNTEKEYTLIIEPDGNDWMARDNYGDKE